MADYEDTKSGPGSLLPNGALETTWQDAVPLVTPEQVRRRHLFGIPLVSAMKNPYTGKPDVMDDPAIADYINEAVTLAETEVGFHIMGRQLRERQAYDQPAAASFGYMTLRQRPVQSIEELAITSSDGVNVWEVPLAWIDTGYLHQGQINLLPFAVAAQSGTVIPTQGPVGQGLLPALFKFNWVPGMWNVTYTTGFRQGHIPAIVNQLIGVVAAMEILSMLATTYARSQSSSLGIDGLSQSQSTPGPALFNDRLEVLGPKRQWLTKKIQRSFGLGLWSDNV